MMKKRNDLQKLSMAYLNDSYWLQAGRMFEDNQDAYEDNLEVCPFDSSHKFKKQKYPYHIKRCKKRDMNKFGVCKYNTNHIFLKEIIAQHQTKCPFNFQQTNKPKPNNPQSSDSQDQPVEIPLISLDNQNHHDNDDDAVLSDCEECLKQLSSIQFHRHSALGICMNRYFQLKLEGVKMRRRQRRGDKRGDRHQRSRNRWLEERVAREHAKPQQ